MKCQALGENGEVCRWKKGIKLRCFHGDSEQNHPAGWVAVYLCEKHKSLYGSDLAKDIIQSAGNKKTR